ncbi:MAG: hypothetical protein ACT4N2_11965 [Hyphomicrobium sp.]
MGKGLYNGWGAHCYAGTPAGPGADRVEDWGCASGLKCVEPFRNSRAARIGVCATAGEPKIGDPTDFGTVVSDSRGHDTYSRVSLLKTPAAERPYEPAYGALDPLDPTAQSTWRRPPQGSTWRYHYSDGSDGFAAGNVRTSVCPHPTQTDRRLPPEAACGAKPRHMQIVRDCLLREPTLAVRYCTGGHYADRDASEPQLTAYRNCLRSNAFNPARCGRPPNENLERCLTNRQRTFAQCLTKTTQTMALRACDLMNPCRDDYICTLRQDSAALNNAMPGACMPPYFLFQFRVDGHLNTVRDVFDTTRPPSGDID